MLGARRSARRRVRAVRATAGSRTRAQARDAASGRRRAGADRASRGGHGDSARSATIPDALIVRALLGALAAGGVAIAGLRAGSLSLRGHWAAFALGTLVVTAGWTWGALFIAYFVTTSLLSQLGRARKETRTESMLPAQRARNALQVGANGGVFAALVLLGEVTGDARLSVAGLGALAAAAADTWATEIGTLSGGAPRSILTGRVVPPGTSGGITAIGSAASVLAAALVALAAHASVTLGEEGAASPAMAVLIGGIGGSLGDSLFGAALQSKRWCEQCRTWTERKVHTCQYRTRHAAGLRWMTNDTVNLLATVLGAGLAFLATVPFASR